MSLLARVRGAAPDIDVAALRRRLDAGLAAMAVDLDAHARDRLIAYLRLLERWNRAYNLSAVRDPLEMIPRHLLDSLTVMPYLRGGRCLDVGSGAGLPGLVDYGSIIGPFSRLLLMLLGWIHFVVRDWGLSIIILTVFVRIAVHPLSRKAQLSMHELKRLQPKLKDLEAKLKGDMRKLGEARMALFREHGVNPAGGCLPMLLQMPILFGLYRGLLYSFDMRQQGLGYGFTWIDDLTTRREVQRTGTEIDAFDVQVIGLDNVGRAAAADDRQSRNIRE